MGQSCLETPIPDAQGHRASLGLRLDKENRGYLCPHHKPSTKSTAGAGPGQGETLSVAQDQLRAEDGQEH